MGLHEALGTFPCMYCAHIHIFPTQFLQSSVFYLLRLKSKRQKKNLKTIIGSSRNYGLSIHTSSRKTLYYSYMCVYFLRECTLNRFQLTYSFARLCSMQNQSDKCKVCNSICASSQGALLKLIKFRLPLPNACIMYRIFPRPPTGYTYTHTQFSNNLLGPNITKMFL